MKNWTRILKIYLEAQLFNYLTEYLPYRIKI